MQDVLALAPRHDSMTLVLSFYLSSLYTYELYHAAYLCARCPLVSLTPSANGGVLRLEFPQHPFNSEQQTQDMR